MTQQLNFADRAAEHITSVTNALEHADERERTVALEADAFGMQLSVLVCWMGALLLAIIGLVGAPIVLVLAPCVPALGSLWYARRHQVSAYRLTARAPLGSTLTWTGFYAVLLFATIAALIYRLYTGEGLLPLSISVEVIGEGLQQAMAIGGLIGAGLGVLVALGLMSLIVWRQRRRAQREEVAALDLD